MTDEKLKQARAIVKQFYPEMPADYSGRRVQIVLAAFDRATDTQVSKHSELADRLDALKSKDIEGHLSDAIQDFLRQQFGIVTPTDDCRTMALGAIAALRQAPDAQVSSLVSDVERLRAIIQEYAGVHGVLVDSDRAKLRAALDGIVSKSDA